MKKPGTQGQKIPKTTRTRSKKRVRNQLGQRRKTLIPNQILSGLLTTLVQLQHK